MLYYQLIINLVEILAAIAGTIYLKKAEYRVSRMTRYFVYFLWLTVVNEIAFGWIPWLIKNVEGFKFLKNTFLLNNLWAYNIYVVVNAFFYVLYFKENVKTKLGNQILNVSLVCYLMCCFGDLIFTDVFFKGPSFVGHILGSILIFLGIMFYFYEILKSDKILSFHRELPFYVAIGSLTLHLVVTPLFIYQEYFDLSKSTKFVEIRWIILSCANIFMYTCYIIGFILCRKNKSYS
ncbi:hypothetical protein M0D21_17540 [Aquimarina sp. D1M17]|uniref:hypothetical protein n=1 Tax=Aquimarina acroporae TaxID=2937283 RepID=UPI0020BFC56E|nr:hypothetical protein [Aquimarina acroporae]MCK8523389.1 hypothetical protein [Aquimarina acroporae]